MDEMFWEVEMLIRQIPVLQDNYSYLLVDEPTRQATVVDPTDAPSILAALAEMGATLEQILCTHHHWDHTGGVLGLLREYPKASVVAGRGDAGQIPGVSRKVWDGDEVEVGALRGRVLGTPCHTRGHVTYLFGEAMFCGDTLFVAGCGRFFEGDAAEMYRSLYGVMGVLGDEVRVYCGHEYSQGNLAFAQHVEPDNVAIREKAAWVGGRRKQGLSTVPSTLGEERQYNPFLRVHVEGIQREMGSSSPVEVMGLLRQRKNAF